MARLKKTDKDRLFNASRNIAFGTISLVIVSILGLVERRVFLDHLSSDYLGINSIFSSILSVLSLAEMGFGSALAYYLYAPLARDDKPRIQILMKFIKKTYRLIGLVILLFGSALLPFLHLIVKTDIPISDVRLFYMVYLLGTVGGYFFSYNTILLEADQKLYIQSLTESAFRIIQYLIQMAVVILTSNFLYYIIVLAVSNTLNFVFIRFITLRKYPYIKSSKIPGLDKETKKKLNKDIRGLLTNKLGNILSYNCDTFLISMLAGTLILGGYSNYTLIFIGIGSVTNLLFVSINASIGNLCALESKKKTFTWFRRLNDYNALIMGLIFSVAAIIINPLLNKMYPTAILFDSYTILFLFYNKYLTNLRNIPKAFEQASGIFYQDRYKPFIEFFFNVIFSFILYPKLGITGIFLGSVISYALSYCWIEPVTLFRNTFYVFPRRGYWLSFIKDNAVFIISTVIGLKYITPLFTGSIISLVLISVLALLLYCIIALIIRPKSSLQLVRSRKILKSERDATD